MKAKRALATTTALFSTLILQPSAAYAQGNLAPPGAPAPTMKTLEQIEPRTPISALPFTISQPGSYYLTTNLTSMTGSHGITIDSDDVTLDLNGFTLAGVPGLGNGIHVPFGPPRSNLSIKNGIVRDWGGNGVSAISANSQLTGLTAQNNTGIGLLGSVITGCSASDNGGIGIQGAVVTQCFSAKNGGAGIDGRNVSECTADGNEGVGIDGETVTACLATANTNDGINAYTVIDSTAWANDGDGIEVSVGGTVQGCSTSFNTDGIVAGFGCTVTDSTASYNKEDGIEVASDCRVADNTCDNNGSGGDGAGVHATGTGNRIEGNHCTGADRGLDIDGTDNYVDANTVLGNADNYDIAAGNQLNLLLGEIPESIDWPASVTLAGSLTGITGAIGITINASDVTIDLDGHALIGVPGSLEGIDVPTDQHNIEIRNGTVRDWGLHGVDASNADNSMLVSIRAFTNGWETILQDGLRIGSSSLVKDCVAERNRYSGITVAVGCAVRECTASYNGTTGIFSYRSSTISECSASFNGGVGFRSTGRSTFSMCTSYSNGGDGIVTGTGSTIGNCTASFNDGDGIEADSATTISDCVASSNDGNGFRAGSLATIMGCTSYSNVGDGIYAFQGGIISECTATINSNGIVFGSNSTVIRCTASNNDGDGFQTSGDGSQIVGNTAGFNTAGGGITILYPATGNRIEGNHVDGNHFGIEVNQYLNMIIRNTATANNTYNYYIGPGNSVGTIVIPPSSGFISGSTGGAGVGSTDPWANFSF